MNCRPFSRRSGGLARRTCLALSLLLLGAVVAQACNVPVFRFALERWRAGGYQVVVFHRGPLGDEARQQVIALEEQQDQLRLNVSVRTVNVDEIEGADEALLASQKEIEFPWMVVRYPADFQNDATIWSGPLTPKNVANLTDSPVRRELVARLARGETAVWLLLESGDKEKDEAAAKVLADELAQLQNELQLPDLTDSPDDQVVANLPLRVEFSQLSVRRDDPAERSLVALLLASEPDLKDRPGDPMIFPVFGRGRTLLPLIGAGITADNVADSASFLVGPCSCEIKELNPGFDLLLKAEWDKLLFEEGVEPPPVVKSPPPDAEPVLVEIPAGNKPVAATQPVAVNQPVVAKTPTPIATPKYETPRGSRKVPYTALAVGGAIVLVLALAAFRPKRAAG